MMKTLKTRTVTEGMRGGNRPMEQRRKGSVRWRHGREGDLV